MHRYMDKYIKVISKLSQVASYKFSEAFMCTVQNNKGKNQDISMLRSSCSISLPGVYLRLRTATVKFVYF